MHNNHMLAEPRIGANVPRPFPRECVVGSGNETSMSMAVIDHAQIITIRLDSSGSMTTFSVSVWSLVCIHNICFQMLP